MSASHDPSQPPDPERRAWLLLMIDLCFDVDARKASLRIALARARHATRSLGKSSDELVAGNWKKILSTLLACVLWGTWTFRADIARQINGRRDALTVAPGAPAGLGGSGDPDGAPAPTAAPTPNPTAAPAPNPAAAPAPGLKAREEATKKAIGGPRRPSKKPIRDTRATQRDAPAPSAPAALPASAPTAPVATAPQLVVAAKADGAGAATDHWAKDSLVEGSGSKPTLPPARIAPPPPVGHPTGEGLKIKRVEPSP